MKVTLVQSDPVWGDPAASLSRIEGKLKDSGMTDLIVLPEMFSTGFVASPAGLAEEDTGSGEPESLGWMRKMAYERNCAVAGSLAFHHGGTYRNRFYFVFPDGKEVHYDKHHLFTYAGEHLRFTAGKERVIVRYRDFRILLQVCYDLRFPAFSRNRMGPDGPEYDLILYVASWPEPRIGAWDALLRARAIENLSYVAGVNRVGNDPKNRYPGHSVLLDYQGNILSNCKENSQDIVTFEILKSDLDSYRESFPALLDADT